MAKIGLEYVDSFANARANAGVTGADDLDCPYYIGEWFIGYLEDGGHEIAFKKKNSNAGERHLHEADLGGKDSTAADSVDLYLIITHGNYKDKTCQLLYDTELTKFIGTSKDWRLGNNCNLEWLMIYGCHTVDKDHLLDHLKVFQGLHILCGAFGDMYDSVTIEECGTDIANHLLCGKPVSDAWVEGASDWWVENHTIAVSVERKEQLISTEEADWPETILYSDHLWGHGITRGDVLPPKQHFMICKYTHRGIWD